MIDILEQQFQNFEFLFGQCHFFAVDCRFDALRIQLQGVVCQDIFIDRLLFFQTSSQHGFDAGLHLLDRERFGNIIVGTQVETCQHIVFSIFGRQEYNGNMSCLFVFLQHAGQLETRYFSHHDVEQQQVVICQVQRKRFFGAVGCIDCVAFCFEIEL